MFPKRTAWEQNEHVSHDIPSKRVKKWEELDRLTKSTIYRNRDRHIVDRIMQIFWGMIGILYDDRDVTTPRDFRYVGLK